eukprot:2605363-Prymnesium_polylepis.1
MRPGTARGGTAGACSTMGRLRMAGRRKGESGRWRCGISRPARRAMMRARLAARRPRPGRAAACP